MAKRLRHGDSDGPAPSTADSLAAFHAGGKVMFEAYYRDHFAAVDRAVGRVLSGADKETAVHEVFLRLMTSPELRLGFRGGSMAAWVSTVARNHAIDYSRRQKLERPLGFDADRADLEEDPSSVEQRVEARMLVERFRRDYLPAEWEAVFELRFLQHLGQEQAAHKLGIGRTTLAYREYRIRSLLKRFMLKLERP
jgi:RNA polymerase sigma-70 factor, ECF subfamily